MQSVGEIKEILNSCPVEKLPEVLPEFAADSRKGVQSLVTRFQKKYDAYLAELERLETLLTYERECYANGFELVAGIDEVGRGPLAGPVVAAAVILPKNCKIAVSMTPKNSLPRNGRSFAKSSKNRQWLGLWVWFPTNALTKSIFCRQLMKPCGKPFPNWKYSRTLSLRTQ